MRFAQVHPDAITAVAVDEPLGACLARVAREGFKDKLNAAETPDEALAMLTEAFPMYAFSNAQLARWTAQVNAWSCQQRIAQQAHDDAQEAAVMASFGWAAFEQGSVDLGRRLVVRAIARVQAARQKAMNE